MKVKDLIDELKKLPPDIDVWVDCSRDYENYQEAKVIIKGHASFGFCGGSFVETAGAFNAVIISN